MVYLLARTKKNKTSHERLDELFEQTVCYLLTLFEDFLTLSNIHVSNSLSCAENTPTTAIMSA